MRHYRMILAITALSLGVTTASAQKPATILEGTWEMISQTIVYPDSVVDRGQGLGPSYKILNSTHFAFGRQTVIGGEAQEDVYAGGGRYDLIGDSLYIEHIEYHSALGNVGASIQFNARVEGDFWYHEGEIGGGVLREVWKRVRD